jgi:hypothetical protein
LLLYSITYYYNYFIIIAIVIIFIVLEYYCNYLFYYYLSLGDPAGVGIKKKHKPVKGRFLRLSHHVAGWLAGVRPT